MTAIGIALDRNAHMLPGTKLAGLVQRIEALGFESVWLLDVMAREPFLAASFILANTKTLKVGTGVATVYSRDAMAAVQVRETLSEYYPGRFMLGLGASNPGVVARRKAEWVAPLPKMKAYLQDMAETELTIAKPTEMAPLYIAAHAPGLQDLAVERTGGIITWILPPDLVEKARQRIGPDLDITANIPCVLSTDADYARSVGRAYLAYYLALPYYQKAYEQCGFEASDWSSGGSDRLVDAIVAWGEGAAIKERVEAFAKAGASRVVLNPISAAKPGADGKTPPGAAEDWDRLPDLASALF